MRDTQHKAFLVVGLVRNCAVHLKNDVARMRSALSAATSVHWLLVESDSTDESVAILGELSDEVESFKFLSLGMLREHIPRRTERIAHCRNAYLNELATNPTYQGVGYVIVSDFDGLNTHINASSIASCWERDDWDVCTANQSGPYYDLWALRHDEWCPNDCWEQFRFLKQYKADELKAFSETVHSKMITIPSDAEWIEVNSAFGGLAIYKRHALGAAKYVGVNAKGDQACEHVQFHLTLKQQGYRIFINPRMINAAYTEHTRPLLLQSRLTMKLQKAAKKVLTSTIGSAGFERLKSWFAKRPAYTRTPVK